MPAVTRLAFLCSRAFLYSAAFLCTAVFAADNVKQAENAWINGVKVQDDVALPSQTGHGKDEEPVLLPIRFQDHGDPVRFRNIWVIDRGLTSVEFPVYPTQEQREGLAKAAAAEQAANEKEKSENEAAAKQKESAPKPNEEKAGPEKEK